MNTTEKLLKQAYDALKLHFEPETTEALQKRWKPKECEKYLFVNAEGYCLEDVWINGSIDNHRYATGNCYQSHEKERAIWEQVTRRKYEQALWDAADWVSGDYYMASWSETHNKIMGLVFSYPNGNNVRYVYGLPRFATSKSAIDAPTRILGDDAERYFTNKIPW